MPKGKVSSIYDEQGRKRCPHCKEYKELDKFAPRKQRPDKYLSWCKTCTVKNASETYSYERYRDMHLFREYGIRLKDYEKIFQEQSGVCAVCGQIETVRTGRTKRSMENAPSLHVDHDHKTGRVRGLLCSNCNQALGLLKESPERIRLLVKYIEKHAPTSEQFAEVLGEIDLPIVSE